MYHFQGMCLSPKIACKHPFKGFDGIYCGSLFLLMFLIQGFWHSAVVHPSMDSLWKTCCVTRTLRSFYQWMCVWSPVALPPFWDTGHFLPIQMSLSLTTDDSHTHTHTRTHIHTHARTHICLALGCNEHISSQIPPTTEVQQNHWPQQTHTHKHKHTHAHTHTYSTIHTHTHKYTHLHACTHTHTHTPNTLPLVRL